MINSATVCLKVNQTEIAMQGGEIEVTMMTDRKRQYIPGLHGGVMAIKPCEYCGARGFDKHGCCVACGAPIKD